MPKNRFFPDGWNHVASEFVVPLTPTAFAKVLRDENGHAYEVWCAGLGETFYSAAQAVHHIRFLARHVYGLE